MAYVTHYLLAFLLSNFSFFFFLVYFLFFTYIDSTISILPSQISSNKRLEYFVVSRLRNGSLVYKPRDNFEPRILRPRIQLLEKKKLNKTSRTYPGVPHFIFKQLSFKFKMNVMNN